MLGPYTLTHIVYVVLVVVFLSVITYTFVHGRRLKAKQKSIEAGGRPLGTEEGILAATEAEKRDDRKR